MAGSTGTNVESRIRLKCRKRKSVSCDGIPLPKQKKCLDSVNDSDSLSSDSSTFFLYSDIEKKQGDDLLHACRLQNEENDFTRFASANDVDSVLPPNVWKSLGKEDFGSLLDHFGEEFFQDFSSCSRKSSPVFRENLERANSSKRNIQSDNRQKESESTAASCKGIKDADKRSCITETDNNNNDYHNSSKIRNNDLKGDRFVEEKFETLNPPLNPPTDPLSIPVIPDKFYAALDCEMVGIGVKGRYNALARCSIVDFDGNVIYDRYIRPSEPITDYRTRWSGITSHHMLHADPEATALHDIYRCMENRIIIGHAVFNDFKVLKRHPPSHMVRDTAQCKLLVELAGLEGQGNSLKKLALSILNKSIQKHRKGHDSVEDAITTLELFKIVRSKWEPDLYTKWMKKGINLLHCYRALEENESKKHEEIDYLSDQYWPSHLLK